MTLHWEGPHMGSFSHWACDDKVRQIQRFHMDVRDWADIAYTALVCPHGYIFEGRGPHVRTAANGTDYGNEHYYAVCYLGGEGDPFTEEGQHGFRRAVRWLRREGAGHKVNGHRDHKQTACPGDVIYNWLKTANWEARPRTPDPKPQLNDVQRFHVELNLLIDGYRRKVSPDRRQFHTGLIKLRDYAKQVVPEK